MLAVHRQRKPAAPVSAEEPGTDVVAGTRLAWYQRQHLCLAKSYPIPSVSIALLVASQVCWFVGYVALANGMLLAVVLLGGIPLL
ncbi:MAG TPA: hypothetical protein VKU38_23220 [Ktedonobacteraceae bacterium]|nr:hypothetical protein [Ktedonobacteraceae bacterium]